MIQQKGKYLSLKATEIAQGINEGKFKSEELIKETLNLAELCNKELNCITQFLNIAALEKARDIDTKIQSGFKYDLAEYPLLGVPISVKDMIDVAGFDTSAGFLECLGKPKKENALVVKSLIKAGAIIYCKTNIPQFGLTIEASNPIHGSTSNPYNIKYTCGGSSGGEAALIASGGSILGVGNDIGGSLRIPAHFCGIYSIRPTSNRISNKGDYPLNPGFEAIKSSFGPMASKMDDLELCFKVLVQDKPWESDERVYYKPYVDYPIKHKLRIGYYVTDGHLPSTPAIQRAILFTINKLKEAGHEVFEYMPMDIYKAMRVAVAILSADNFEVTMRKLQKGEQIDSHVKPIIHLSRIPNIMKYILSFITRFIGQNQLSDVLYDNCFMTIAHYYDLIDKKNLITKETIEKWEQTVDKEGKIMDCIICPVTSLPAHMKNNFYKVVTSTRYTMIYNLIDFPSGVVPATHVDPKLDQIDVKWYKDNNVDQKCWLNKEHYGVYDANRMEGLPVGIQIVTRRYEEEKLIGIMKLVDNLIKN